MIDFLGEYPYFVYGVLSVIAYFLILYFNPKHRTPLLFAAFLGLPSLFFSILFGGESWNPKRLTTFFGISPGDILFCFYSGGLAWILSYLFIWKRIEYTFAIKAFIKRYIFLLAFGAFWVAALGLFTSLSVYYLTIIIMLLWLSVLVLLKKIHWKVVTSGAFLGLVYSLFSYRIQLYIWPQLPQYWDLSFLTGMTFWGIPVEEIVWMTIFTPMWAGTVSYLLDVKIRR